MTVTLQQIGAITAIVIPIAGFAQGIMIRRHRRLKKKYRQALHDLRAFYHLEDRLCGAIAQLEGRKALGIKKRFRQSLRADNIQSPSDRTTPFWIDQELSKL